MLLCDNNMCWACTSFLACADMLILLLAIWNCNHRWLKEILGQLVPDTSLTLWYLLKLVVILLLLLEEIKFRLSLSVTLHITCAYYYVLPGTSHCRAGKIFTTKTHIHRVIYICALPALFHQLWEDGGVLAVFSIPVLGKLEEMYSQKSENESKIRSTQQH